MVKEHRQKCRLMENADKYRKLYLAYFEEWPDASLKNLALLYRGDDIRKPRRDPRIQALQQLILTLRNNNKNDELFALRQVIDNIVGTDE